MTMLSELTKEQVQLQSVVKDKWIKVGLDTGPANKTLAEQGLKMAYAAAGLEAPGEIYWEASPIAGLKRAAKLAPGQEWSAIFYGSQEAGWLSFHDYFAQIGVNGTEPLQGLMQISQNAGWCWFFDQAAILTDRPLEIHRDDQGRLHNLRGKAIQYRDGWGFYSVHGVRVPEQIVIAPYTLTTAQIESEQNAEVRRIMIDQFGVARFLEESGSEVVSEDSFGVLYRKLVPDDEPIVMVKVRNSTPEPDGSFKHYFLRVEPELRPMLGGEKLGEPQKLTALNAVASTFGLTGDQYQRTLRFQS